LADATLQVRGFHSPSKAKSGWTRGEARRAEGREIPHEHSELSTGCFPVISFLVIGLESGLA